MIDESIFQQYHSQETRPNQMYSLPGMAADFMLWGMGPFSFKNFVYGDRLSKLGARKERIESVLHSRRRNLSLGVTKGFYRSRLDRSLGLTAARIHARRETTQYLRHNSLMQSRIAGKLGSVTSKIRNINTKAFLLTRPLVIASLLGLSIEGGFRLARDLMHPEVAQQMKRDQEMGALPYLDTVNTYTARQRALAAIHNNQMSARAIITQEAGFMHM